MASGSPLSGVFAQVAHGANGGSGGDKDNGSQKRNSSQLGQSASVPPAGSEVKKPKSRKDKAAADEATTAAAMIEDKSVTVIPIPGDNVTPPAAPVQDVSEVQIMPRVNADTALVPTAESAAAAAGLEFIPASAVLGSSPPTVAVPQDERVQEYMAATEKAAAIAEKYKY